MKDEGDQVLQQFADDSGGRAFFPYHVDDLAQLVFNYIGDRTAQPVFARLRPHAPRRRQIPQNSHRVKAKN